MAKLKVRNFGPIRDGLTENNEWIEFKKVTLFIGEQATGKSTIAKLYAGLCWIEKDLAKDEDYHNRVTDNLFKSKVVEYFSLQEYLREDTFIEFTGSVYHFLFQNGILKASRFDEKTKLGGVFYPKIMYIPADRNFVSSMYGIENITNLSKPLLEFWDMFNTASREIKDDIILPMNNIRMMFDNVSKQVYIKGSDYSIQLTNSSSGIQSLAPLFLVSNYLSDVTSLSSDKLSIEQIEYFRETLNDLKDEVVSTLSKYQNKQDSEFDVKNKVLEISKKLYKYHYSHLINIIEEPEQNLFPTSQQDTLYKLIEFITANKIDMLATSELILTSHSPYLINYLTIAIKAHELKIRLDELIEKKSPAAKNLKKKLSEVISLNSTIDKNEVVIYSLKDGNIEKLATYNGLPSDENMLNSLLSNSNDQFDKLLDIEQEL